jgi:hypothetical protein
MPKVKLDATGAVPKSLKVSKQADPNVTFESDLKSVKVSFAAGSPLGVPEFAMSARSLTRPVKFDVPEGVYSYTFTWDDGTRGKPTLSADIDISR